MNKGGGPMHSFQTLARLSAASMALAFTMAMPSAAQSTLLESVKRNPKEAKALCRQFKALNAKGESALSGQAIGQLASQRNLSTTDAEILATYVIGLHCPDVR